MFVRFHDPCNSSADKNLRCHQDLILPIPEG